MGSLHDVICVGLAVVDTGSAHDLSQAVALDCQAVCIVVLRDHGALDMRAALDDHMWQLALKLLHDEVELVTASLVRLDMHLVLTHDTQVLLLDLKLACLEDALLDTFNRNLELEGIDRV